ncbi:MAG: hypothetical protein WA058_03305 [Minisyncoccia bacterium]
MYTRHNEIRLLFYTTIELLKKSHGQHFREWQIFVEVLGDNQETSDAFLRYLHDVSTCPPEVLEWCKEQEIQQVPA